MADRTKTRLLLLAMTLLAPLSMSVYAQRVDVEVPGPRFLSFRYQLTGESRDELLREATMRAAMSAAGRVYFSDYMLRGRRLLGPYITEYWDRFRAGQRVHVDEVRGGRRYLDVEIMIDQQQLLADLAEKRFLYRPALRPLFYIFLEEKAPGGKSVSAGRDQLLEMLAKREYRYLWEGESRDDPNVPFSKKKEVELSDPPASKDVTASEEDLLAACREAQRNEVEVFIAGSLTSEVKNEETLYFDKYAFVKTRLSLKLVRSDTAEVLESVEIVRHAAHQDASKAAQAATRAAVSEAAPKLFDVFDRVWAKTILRKADLRLMVTGVKPDGLNVVRQVLTGALPEAEIFERGAFGEVAVLTLTWGGEVAQLLRDLNLAAHPDFTLTPAGPQELIMEVH